MSYPCTTKRPNALQARVAPRPPVTTIRQTALWSRRPYHDGGGVVWVTLRRGGGEGWVYVVLVV